MKVVRRPKFYPKAPKNSLLSKDKHAVEIFLKKISEFKRKRKYHKWISVNQITLRGGFKRAFEAVVDSLEEFRLHLAMVPNLFYRLVSEFILVPSGRKYYPLRMIFVEEENQASEEFLSRIIDTLTWIGDITIRDFNNDSAVKSVMNFAKELSNRKISADGATFKSKDWYCLVAIREVGKKKKWSEVELLGRIAKFYKRKIKKVTVEMVLGDLTHGELDKLELEDKNKKKNKKVKSYTEVIDNDPWYEEWKAGIPG